MRALLVVNPQATATSAAGRDVIAHALASSVKLDVIETHYRGHAKDAAAHARAERFDLVVAHGGDGTVNEVVNGLLGPEGVPDSTPALGVVPGGSANVFARALGLPQDPVEATHRLLRGIETRAIRQVGLGKADDRWFTFNAGLGWDAEVVAEVERRRVKKASPWLYAKTSALSYFQLDHRHPVLTVELPNGEVETGLYLAFVSNTNPWTYLGSRPVRLNPATTFSNGLGLFALRSLNAPTVVKSIWQALNFPGNPKNRNLLQRDDVEWITVSAAKPVRLQVDGDPMGERTFVRFRSVPQALTVIG